MAERISVREAVLGKWGIWQDLTNSPLAWIARYEPHNFYEWEASMEREFTTWREAYDYADAQARTTKNGDNK